MKSFREFINETFSNTGHSYSDPRFYAWHDLPTPTLEIPTKTIGGRITRINYTENPISIHLSNGTIWNLTKKQWDYLLATNKEPRLNGQIQIEVFLDGTIKSVNCNYMTQPSDFPVREDEPTSNKPERIFGKPLPF